MSTTIDYFRNSTDFETFAAGDVIFKQGDASAGRMYVVIGGEVDVTINGKFVHTIGEGGIVGEMALIDTQPRSATVTAKVESKLVPVDEARFKFMVQQTPFFAIQVMRVLVERLREATAIGAEYL